MRSATPKSAWSSRPLAPSESSVATIGSLVLEPCCNRSLIIGSVILTWALVGSSTRMPLGSSLAPRRNGGRNTAVLIRRSSVNSVPA